jgi:transposase
VYVEDLAVRGLARTRLAKSVGLSSFTAMLEYKARLHGRYFARIGRFEPTSQACGGEVRPAETLALADEAGSRRGAA